MRPGKNTLAVTLLVAGCATAGLRRPAQEAQERERQKPLPEACQRRCVTPYGEKLGGGDGVPAYSNCSSACISPRNGYAPQTGATEAVYTGLEWQCVEFARRSWLSQRGLVFGSVEAAADMWAQVRAAHAPGGGRETGVEALENGGQAIPEVGDLVIWKRVPGRPRLRYGHVAVVVAVDRGAGWVRVAEQNFSNRVWPQEGWSRALPLRRTGTGFILRDLDVPEGTVRGWLHLEETGSAR